MPKKATVKRKDLTVTNGSNTDFRIKILVVHPDGRRQKFLVTFPDRKSLKIDQRYIGLPITMRVDFVPGAIIVKPGTGHTLTVAERPVKEHSVQLNDVVGLDQYVIEFLELPEPLPIEEATRFVNLSDMVEATVIAQIPIDSGSASVKQDFTPTPPRIPQSQPSSFSPPLPSVGLTQPDPEDSTALIRRLQIPGANVPNARQYQSLEPAASSDRTEPQHSAQSHYGDHQHGPTDSIPVHGSIDWRSFAKTKNAQMAMGAALLVAMGVFLAKKPSSDIDATSELESQKSVPLAEAPEPQADSSFGLELEIPAAPEPDPISAQASAEDLIPTPKALDAPVLQQNQGQPQVPMGTTISKPDAFSLGFDDQTGFDPISIDQFFTAIDNSDERRIKEILESRQVDVNLSRRRGYAALHLAAAQGQIDVVKLLLRLKADPNVIDASGATPLMWAVFRKHKAVVKFLASRTDLKIQRQGGETAYDLAKRMNQRDLLTVLDPNPKKKSIARSRRSSQKSKTAKNDAQSKANRRAPTALPAKSSKDKKK